MRHYSSRNIGLRCSMLIAFLALLAAAPNADFTISVTTNGSAAPLLEVGDSIAAGYCLSSVTTQQFAYLVGLDQKSTVTDKGVNGYQVDTIESNELGTPQAPLVPDTFGTVIIVGGTNDMINLWNTYPKYYTTIDTLAQKHIALIQDARTLEPHAKIIDVGVRDLGYNDSRITSDNKAIYANQISQYNAEIANWISTQSYVKYFPIFPEASYPQYYPSADICGPWHPSALAEPMYATGIESLLRQIPTQ